MKSHFGTYVENLKFATLVYNLPVDVLEEAILMYSPYEYDYLYENLWLVRGILPLEDLRVDRLLATYYVFRAMVRLKADGYDRPLSVGCTPERYVHEMKSFLMLGGQLRISNEQPC